MKKKILIIGFGGTISMVVDEKEIRKDYVGEVTPF